MSGAPGLARIAGAWRKLGLGVLLAFTLKGLVTTAAILYAALAALGWL